ncbi:AGAP013031-PA-like protein [Anopheles sinensis]|uniref:AGAP013031-PA-like protein n=1 Tax=Anopheles sinensis TaxID=74873 RepID=A0A084VHL0_ANOSI|nr:AGAP013031-PA-like protein [Anopheles sinensis]
MNNTVDEFYRVETFACKTYLPPLELYYSEYRLSLILSLTVGSIIWLWVTFVFVRVMRLIKKHTEKDQVMVLMIANTVYLIVVTFSVLALLLPHVAVVCDIVPFVAFCWCILVFFRYLKQSVGGDSVIIALYESKQLDAPQNLFFDVFYYILPFVIASIVCYVVSSISFIKTVAPLYPDNPIFKRFFLLQLVLLITKPQIIILELIYNFLTFECTIAGEPKAYFNKGKGKTTSSLSYNPKKAHLPMMSKQSSVPAYIRALRELRHCLQTIRATRGSTTRDGRHALQLVVDDRTLRNSGSTPRSTT